MKILIILLLIAEGAMAEPWHFNVLWQREGLDDSSNYGHYIVALGDQNNDGYNDWAVCAGSATTPLESIELFHGGNPPAQEPYRTYLPNDSNMTRLLRIVPIGDVNGDHYVDYWVRAKTRGFGLNRYWTYYGGPNDDGVADSVLDCEYAPSVYKVYSSIGDVNGDGLDDIAEIIIGHLSGTNYYWGGQSDTISDWHLDASIGFFDPPGDINDDGYSDLRIDLTSAEGKSLQTIFLGGAVPDTKPFFESNDAPIFRTFVGNFIGAAYDDLAGVIDARPAIQAGGPNFDTKIDLTLNFHCEGIAFPTGVGDVNADGFDDLIFACDNYGGTFGLFLGGLTPSPSPVLVSTPLGKFSQIQAVAGLGDVNGDGVGDFAIGSHGELGQEGARGQVLIFSGDSTYHVSKENRK